MKQTAEEAEWDIFLNTKKMKRHLASVLIFSLLTVGIKIIAAAQVFCQYCILEDKKCYVMLYLYPVYVPVLIVMNS